MMLFICPIVLSKGCDLVHRRKKIMMHVCSSSNNGNDDGRFWWSLSQFSSPTVIKRRTAATTHRWKHSQCIRKYNIKHLVDLLLFLLFGFFHARSIRPLLFRLKDHRRHMDDVPTKGRETRDAHRNQKRKLHYMSQARHGSARNFSCGKLKWKVSFCVVRFLRIRSRAVDLFERGCTISIFIGLSDLCLLPWWRSWYTWDSQGSLNPFLWYLALLWICKLAGHLQS